MGASQFYGPIQVEYTIDLPAEFTLSQNFPNPFNPETSVEIQIPKKTNLLVRVHDLLGNQVRTVVNDDREAGTYTVTWDGLDEQHSPVPSGIYFLRVEAETYRDIRKMTLIR